MQFKRVNRTEAEKVFINVENNEGSSLAAGSVAQWDLTTDADGVKVRQPDTGNLHAFAGIVDAAIADGEFGLVQVYGYRTNATVFQTGTSQDTGAVLVPTAGAAYLASIATSTASNATVTLQPVLAVLAETIASSSASATIAAKAFIRAL